MRTFVAFVFLLLAGCMDTQPAEELDAAPDLRGILRGFVHDTYGNRLEGAIVILHGNPSRELTTNENGYSVFSNLTAGEHLLSASHPSAGAAQQSFEVVGGVRAPPYRFLTLG